jgi:hypothetical protein
MADLEAQLRAFSRHLTSSRTISLQDVMQPRPKGIAERRERTQSLVLAGIVATFLVAVAGVIVFSSRGGDDARDVVPPVGGPPTTVVDAEDWLVPPLTAGPFELVRVLHAGAFATNGSESIVTFGASTYRASLPSSSRFVTFQYGQTGEEPPGAIDADARVDITRPATAQASDVETADPGEQLTPAVTVFRLGEVCTEPGQPNVPLSGYVRPWPCEHRALVIGNDFVAELSARTEPVLEGLVSGMSIGSVDDLRAALAGIEGADAL